MRLVGLDFGEKRIGVAVSDPLGITAQAAAVLDKQATYEADAAELKKLLEQYPGVTEIVVGLPKTMKGKIGPQAEKVQAFIEVLKQELPLKVTPWDERLTTVEAERTLISAGVSRKKRKSVIDKTAAVFILQGYLDCHKK